MDVNELYNQAYELYEEKKYAEALKLIAEIKRVDPKYPSAYLLEIFIFDKTNDYVKLNKAAQKILPYFKFSSVNGREVAADIFDMLGHAQIRLAMYEEAFKNIKLAAQLTSKNSWTKHRWGVVIFYANHLENFSVKDFHVLYSSLKKCFDGITPFEKKFYAHEKIRIGFLSADFRAHAVMDWSWALLTLIDKNRFETYFYSTGERFDNISEYLRDTADTWRNIFDLTDEEAAKKIHDDEIDILFDLSGYTRDSRLDVMVYRPATVQISGIGYMNSTGLDAVDYFLTDIYCEGNPDYFTEKLLVMPHTHFCYSSGTKLEPAAEPPCVKNNFVTFGSFNKFQKLTPSMLNAWKKILDGVPNSRLILKNSILGKEDERNFVAEKLAEYGFDLSRVELRPPTKSWLKDYSDVDIALDTFPYTGGVTTCEALYMGVPVVSLYGDRHGSRFGLSILMNVGLGGLAVDSYDAYIQTAIDLANDKNSLIAMRKELRGMMKNSPLMDAKNYVRTIEEAFVKILDDARK